MKNEAKAADRPAGELVWEVRGGVDWVEYRRPDGERFKFRGSSVEAGDQFFAWLLDLRRRCKPENARVAGGCE